MRHRSSSHATVTKRKLSALGFKRTSAPPLTLLLPRPRFDIALPIGDIAENGANAYARDPSFKRQEPGRWVSGVRPDLKLTYVSARYLHPPRNAETSMNRGARHGHSALGQPANNLRWIYDSPRVEGSMRAAIAILGLRIGALPNEFHDLLAGLSRDRPCNRDIIIPGEMIVVLLDRVHLTGRAPEVRIDVLVPHRQNRNRRDPVQCLPDVSMTVRALHRTRIIA